VRVCVTYDCLFPYTVGGAERWYRALAERLAAEGHQVTYLTLRQWDRGQAADLDSRVRVVVAGPRMALYTEGGRRRIWPPLVFGLGVLLHLLRNGRRYDVVHSASFPYFSLLAAGAARPLARFALIVDWHEVWSRDYWHEYLGHIGGEIGFAVQRLCARLPQRAFCFSRLHSRRLREEKLRGEVTVLEGEYVGSLEGADVHEVTPLVVFAGRLIPEKRPALAVAAFAAAAGRIEGLRCLLYGDGPERGAVGRAIDAHGVAGTLSAPGFVEAAKIDQALRRAMCMLSTSRREGYGLVVVEAAARGTPSIVVAGEDNAATELIEEGVNGTIAPNADPECVADAIGRVHHAGVGMRRSTALWFARNAARLSLDSSLETVLSSYAARADAPRRPARTAS
jgi:glycosyltransferase involved in cell wall biosynthesis